MILPVLPYPVNPVNPVKNSPLSFVPVPVIRGCFLCIRTLLAKYAIVYFTYGRLNVIYTSMKTRNHWLDGIGKLWLEKNIVWLSGVRRTGKTSLCKQLKNAVYFNCDLPSVQRRLSDAEFFFAQHKPGVPLILDEIHRVEDPSLVLKIAADEFPKHRVLATGSSTLHATKKFRDTLTDRKRTLFLPPVLRRECLNDFGVQDLDRRLLHGGFPEILLSDKPLPDFFEDWMDSFYARDIQELFGVRNRSGFLSLLKLLCLRSGGFLDIADLAKETGLSRPTVMSHLDAMEIAHAIIRLPPFHGGGHREIIRQPRVYAFDTGLIAHVRGWESIRDTDRGVLWENLVLDELRVRFPARSIHYWRDKSQRELDFVIERSQGNIDAIEAKIRVEAFDTRSLRTFRDIYPRGNNYLISPQVRDPYCVRMQGLQIRVCDTRDMCRAESF